MSYTYDTTNQTVPGFGTVSLEYIEAAASNIVLKAIDSTVPASGFFGINGGFFDSAKQILSIAVNNNKPVAGDIGGVGVGWANTYTRGTVRWDGQSGAMSVSVVDNANNIVVNNCNFYWAQGGVSMRLDIDNKTTWENAITNGKPENISWKANTERSGLVYRLTGPLGNRTATAFLVITRTPCTLWDFRQAIKSGISEIVDGVFLDGGGSTQMNCTEVKFAGDGRQIPQMVALTRT